MSAHKLTEAQSCAMEIELIASDLFNAVRDNNRVDVFQLIREMRDEIDALLRAMNGEDNG